MTEPKRWTVHVSEKRANLTGWDHTPVKVVAAADFDRLRDERDRLRQEAGVMGSSHNPPENPYFEGEGHNDLHGAWAEGYAAGKVASDDAWISGDMVRLSMQDSYSEGLAAGRAAATPDPPSNPHRDEYGNPLPGQAGQAAGWDGAYTCSGCDTIHVPAASPDERLREAASVLADQVLNGDWANLELFASDVRRVLAAADREAPDEPKETT